MKKTFILVLASLFAVCTLVSCTNDSKGADADKNKSNLEETTDDIDTDISEAPSIDEEAPATSDDNEITVSMPFSIEEVEEKIIGYWEFSDEMYGYTSGYRFNADGTLDFVYDRAWMYGGIYKVEADGIHFSADEGATWDPLVMEIIDISDTEVTVAFDGVSEVYTKSDAELMTYDEYMAELEASVAEPEDVEADAEPENEAEAAE